jgi:hypothetical protein
VNSLSLPLVQKTPVRSDPHNPRTLFFNDSTVIGWVRGGFIEVATESPEQGIIFYTLAQESQEKPQFKRQNDCLTCHDSYDALGAPGMLVRSNFVGPNAMTLRNLGSYNIDQRSPLTQRWGGWYVTGNSGSIRHMGNAIVTDEDHPDSAIGPETLNLDSLVSKFDTHAFLSPYSDVVALMVFEHQMHIMNLFTRLGWQTRYALSQPRVEGDYWRATANELADYMLFVDEAPLANPIRGSSGFAEKFSSEGPHDGKGRSFRQLDLEKRLMRYPCSYMIYSEAFDALPAEARDAVYKRLWQILSGTEKNPKYAGLSLSHREAVVEILRATKKNLPAYFQPIAQ